MLSSGLKMPNSTRIWLIGRLPQVKLPLSRRSAAIQPKHGQAYYLQPICEIMLALISSMFLVAGPKVLGLQAKCITKATKATKTDTTKTQPTRSYTTKVSNKGRNSLQGTVQEQLGNRSYSICIYRPRQQKQKESTNPSYLVLIAIAVRITGVIPTVKHCTAEMYVGAEESLVYCSKRAPGKVTRCHGTTARRDLYFKKCYNRTINSNHLKLYRRLKVYGPLIFKNYKFTRQAAIKLYLKTGIYRWTKTIKSLHHRGFLFGALLSCNITKQALFSDLIQFLEQFTLWLINTILYQTLTFQFGGCLG